MTRHKKPKTYAPQASDSPAVRRRKRQRMARHIDMSEDYPIAVWSHRWSFYLMDDRPGLWQICRDVRAIPNGDSLVAAWDTFAKKWSVFARLSADRTAKVIEDKIELENMPF